MDFQDKIVMWACALAGLFLIGLLGYEHLTAPSVPTLAERLHVGVVTAPLAMEARVPSTSPKTAATSERLAKRISQRYKTLDKDEAAKVVKLVYKHSRTEKVNPKLVLGLIGAESSFRSGAKSSVGAVGYTQVWPKWHQDKIGGRNIHHPSTNIEVGVKVLKECLRRRGNEREALACYNGATRADQAARYIKKVYAHMASIEAMNT